MDKKNKKIDRTPRVVFDVLFKVNKRNEVKGNVFTKTKCVIKRPNRIKEDIHYYFDHKLKEKLIDSVVGSPEAYSLAENTEANDFYITFVEATIMESFHNHDLKVGDKILARKYDDGRDEHSLN